MVKESEIFYGFCKYFSSLGITADPTPSTWKYRIYYFFDVLGRMLGYEVYTEDTFKKNDGIKKLVGKRVDMTWVSPKSNRYVLALEYENTKNIDDEIMKLASMTGLRVLVMFRYDFTEKEIIDKIKLQQIKDNPEQSKFLVLILPHLFQNWEPFEKLRAWLFDAKGQIIGFGTAEGYVGIDGVCSFRSIRWKTRKNPNS